ncbi:MAG: rhomboid family intramembrane serine protease [Acidobacteria bacterium]|nr:rhomboid family intramembrane serine protease [Acidobacteriota bacterium]MCL5288575.1 rhomboid family intramembrane serine protease [Acidobacteriota bacterium]
MFIFPLSHEDLRGRRWPWITIGIIVINILVFFGTYGSMEDQSAKLTQTRVKVLLLVANHPYVRLTPETQKLVETFKTGDPKTWARLAARDRRLYDEAPAWDVRMREFEPSEAHAEMAALDAEWKSLAEGSILQRYGFVPAEKTTVSYVTANFLHGGWLHIIFNMWFLWLAGSVLEDVWGRLIYPIFYFLAGAVAVAAHAAMFPHSMVPLIGASGAVAGLMGAFLVRFFKTKIDFVFIWWFLSLTPNTYRFKAPAFLMLPLWLGMQLLSAWLLGDMSDVAYWAHIGGFVFGVVIALGLKVSGLEHKVDQAIEAEVSWQADPRVTKASGLLEQNQLDAAIAELRQAVQEKPDLLEAHTMLEQLYWRTQNFEAHRATLAELCRLNIKSKDMDAAWEHYGAFTNAGGEKIATGDWVHICRWLESQQNLAGAAAEYEKFAHAYPADKLAVYSLVAAARLHLKKLNNKPEAARLYREAAASSVPHLDWDDAIKRGLAEATT